IIIKMSKVAKLHLCIWLLALTFAGSHWATAAAPASGNESLGGKLLDDLNPNLFGPPAASLQNNSSPTSEPAAVPTAHPTFDKRIGPGLSGPNDGEDLGQAPGGAALAHIEEQMQTAQSLLHQAKSPDRAGETQQQAVAELDALIAQLSKQCQ